MGTLCSPPKERKIEGWVNFVPRGTCSNCGQALPPLKTKQKKVLENVMWIRDMTTDFLYPYYGNEPLVFKKFEFKRTKITIEWEE